MIGAGRKVARQREKLQREAEVAASKKRDPGSPRKQQRLADAVQSQL